MSGALVAPSSRTAAGYRQYSPSAVRRIEFIKRAQTLGFRLDEVANLLALEANTPKRCDDVGREASIAVARIDQKLAELTRMRTALGKLVEGCRENRGTVASPLLEALVSDKSR
jgi:DNA-binding transcriptional MerR regulator